jgi:hypothetical protein
MSLSYDLVCIDCHEGITLGQLNGSGKTIYYGNEKYMEKLNDFLWKHENHQLQFGYDNGFYDSGIDYEMFKEES